MNLDTITIYTSPEESESLVQALRAVARSASLDLPYDEACAVLGISFVATAGEGSPGLWARIARDALLSETARLFGIHLRDLHPPDVGVDMLNAEEYPQHFELSYKPLIRRALQHGQPVLAWRGWEGPAADAWGVITASAGDELLGVVPGTTTRVRLVQPAMQCYVVEQIEPRTPTPDEIMAHTIAHVDALLSRPESVFGGRIPSSFGIRTGAAAYDRWAEWLSTQQPATGESTAREDYRAYACALSFDRLSAARFLSRSVAVQSPEQAAILDALVTACEEVAGSVSRFCGSDDLEVFWSTPEGHQELLEAIRAAQAADREIAEHIHSLAAATASEPTRSQA